MAERETALITGASGGIGLELARLFAADGHDLVLVARSAERLAALADELRAAHGIGVRHYPADLSEPRAARSLWSEVSGAGVRVDALVNNAGLGLWGAVAEQDVDALERMLQLNVATLTVLTRLALPAMLARRRGRIMNVASVAAFQPGGPGMSAYYASKAYVLAFSRGLTAELRGSGVTVTVLAPGPTESGFEAAGGGAGTRLFQVVPVTTPAEVARAGYRGMRRGAKVVLPGAAAKLLAFAGELPPRSVALEVNRELLKK